MRPSPWLGIFLCRILSVELFTKVWAGVGCGVVEVQFLTLDLQYISVAKFQHAEGLSPSPTSTQREEN
jgi:hypothetical protein